MGSSLLGVGFAIASGSAFAGVLVLAYLGTTLVAAMRVEEAALREKFGGEYDAYASGARPREPRRFSIALAIRNGEHRAVLGLAAVILWMTLAAGCLAFL